MSPGFAQGRGGRLEERQASESAAPASLVAIAFPAAKCSHYGPCPPLLVLTFGAAGTGRRGELEKSQPPKISILRRRDDRLHHDVP
jgi:hypothetical protein